MDFFFTNTLSIFNYFTSNNIFQVNSDTELITVRGGPSPVPNVSRRTGKREICRCSIERDSSKSFIKDCKPENV